MKRMNLILAILLCGPGLASAQTLSDAGTLRKLSMHLRTIPPTAEEYKELAASADHAKFLEAKAAEYVQTKAFTRDLRYRLFELMRFENNTRKEAELNSAALTASLILGENRPWDELWTGKVYRYVSVPNAPYSANSYLLYQNSFDDDFLAEINPLNVKVLSEFTSENTNPPQKYILKDVRFADNDDRIAGLFTTARFASRYANSGLNKNRKRSAALFRILLCDPMSISIDATAASPEDDINAVFEAEAKTTKTDLQEELATASIEKRHGTDATCMACHYKLDPMGQNLQSLGSSLSGHPFPGALVFRGSDGRMVHEKARGVGALTAKIVQQPEYAACQTKWFWERYIGVNVPLSPERHRQVIAAFEAGGRRPREMVQYLVMQPEFRQAPQVQVPSDVVTFARVKPLLERCDRCHGAMGFPAFVASPITRSGDPAEHDVWIAKMKNRVHRPESDPMRMPRDWRSWETKDLELVQKWLDQGASYAN